MEALARLGSFLTPMSQAVCGGWRPRSAVRIVHLGAVRAPVGSLSGPGLLRLGADFPQRLGPAAPRKWEVSGPGGSATHHPDLSPSGLVELVLEGCLLRRCLFLGQAGQTIGTQDDQRECPVLFWSTASSSTSKRCMRVGHLWNLPAGQGHPSRGPECASPSSLDADVLQWKMLFMPANFRVEPSVLWLSSRQIFRRTTVVPTSAQN